MNRSTFPRQIRLQNVCNITGRVFDFGENPLWVEASKTITTWFSQYTIYDEKKKRKFLAGQFDFFAGISFPDCDLERLETCLMFYFWAFVADDLADEGELANRPEEVEKGHMIQQSIINKLDSPEPEYPYASMLWHLLRRMKKTATPGVICRFIEFYYLHSNSHMEQCTLRSGLVKAIAEYSVDLDVPDYVFEHPVMKAMSDATDDILTWPNDLCSFNKEQADGDYQNLISIIMADHKVDLQTALDMLVDMIAQRVQDYVNLKKQLPNWGPKVNAAVAKYNKYIEYMVQGCVVWYYSSRRYFRGVSAIGQDYIMWDLYEPSEPTV
ncbi:terpenoid synthase [Atractiella rhizophila]|nr:terpenoid synthase [Atractiella rhizophila]